MAEHLARTRAVRADALRSRARLLDAAEEVVARDGASASLEEIARVAGVGSATLHRHFPSRWALLQAIFAQRVDELAALADDLASAEAPDRAFEAWLSALVSTVARTAGLAPALSRPERAALPGDDTCHQVVARAGGGLLATAQGSGHLRPDARIDDVLTVVTAISSLPDEVARRRMLAVLTTGLAGSPRR